MKIKATAIIQARMNSERLAGKSMLPLAGKPLIWHIIERAKAIENISYVVLATGISKINDPLELIAHETGISIFRGSENNVLERYKLASDIHCSDYIVRITGDNPFTDPIYASMSLEIASESGADLSSLMNIPLGTAVEIIKKTALDEAFSMSHEGYHFEHVTPYIKEHPELFNITRHPASFENPFEHLRLTVDTIEDYTLASKIYDSLYKGKIFSLESVIAFLEKNPALVKINSEIKQRGMTHSSND
jgi:spore coat polysaccharide biosynthesis protein SpsF